MKKIIFTVVPGDEIEGGNDNDYIFGGNDDTISGDDGMTNRRWCRK